ncbi:hypothetical protein [Actinokineospora pegani]|uniref:hypothetical protein n=1 Tax=Actinokineospora pegani TaxID=2654637 RepID=UPI0012E9F08F|nr:hypothetical protein [Actinokineospora pegani]
MIESGARGPGLGDERLVGGLDEVERRWLAGGVAVEPDAARRAAAACRSQLARIDEALATARGLAQESRFGDCAVGTALRDKFAAKATGGPASLVALLSRSRDLLAVMAERYDRTAEGYSDVEEQTADRMRSLTGRVG